MGMKSGKRRGRIIGVYLTGIMLICIFFSGGASVDCAAKTTDEVQEVTDFVTAYYKALSPEGLTTLADYVDDPETEGFRMDLFRQEALLRYGVEGWENIETIVCPMSDGEHWIVAVSSDLIVSGFDVGMPGLKVELVGRNADGELKIASYSDAQLEDDFAEEIREISLSDEILEQNSKIAAAYNALIVERQDMLDWIMETNEAVEKEVGEALEAGLFDEPLKNLSNSSTSANGRYVVKKGDHLWRIAEEQLGDGMRWTELYEKNKAVIGENPDLLYVGIELKLK